MTHKSKSIHLYLAVGLGLYVLVYFVLSRTSAAIVGDGTFYYVPCREDFIARREMLQRVHQVMFYIFFPMQYLDEFALDGPEAATAPPMLGVGETNVGSGL
jgi:hypothetical protein